MLWPNLKSTVALFSAIYSTEVLFKGISDRFKVRIIKTVNYFFRLERNVWQQHPSSESRTSIQSAYFFKINIFLCIKIRVITEIDAKTWYIHTNTEKKQHYPVN